MLRARLIATDVAHFTNTARCVDKYQLIYAIFAEIWRKSRQCRHYFIEGDALRARRLFSGAAAPDFLSC